MKIKINWGTGILIGIIIFVVISVTMTVIFMTQEVNLVTSQYYENSFEYQDEIDKQSRTKELSHEVKIDFNSEKLNIIFPPEYLSKNIRGEIYFYRPSNQALDFKLPLLLTADGNQIIPTQKLQKGFWRLKLNWTMDDNRYYFERVIMLE